MDELKPNEEVLVGYDVALGMEVYERITGFTHRDTRADALHDYLRIGFTDNTHIDMSPGHLLTENVAAMDARVGDSICTDREGKTKTISDISAIRLPGKVCPLTPTGRIVVDDTLTTCFTVHYTPSWGELQLLKHVAVF